MKYVKEMSVKWVSCVSELCLQEKCVKEMSVKWVSCVSELCLREKYVKEMSVEWVLCVSELCLQEKFVKEMSVKWVLCVSELCLQEKYVKDMSVKWVSCVSECINVYAETNREHIPVGCVIGHWVAMIFSIPYYTLHRCMCMYILQTRKNLTSNPKLLMDCHPSRTRTIYFADVPWDLCVWW